MAANSFGSFFLFLNLTLLLYLTTAQITQNDDLYSPFVESCPALQYFDIQTLQCNDCPKNTTTSADGLTCECNPGYKYIVNFGNGNVKCEPCPARKVTSADGWDCVSCLPDSRYNGNTCESCSDTKAIPAERDLDGTRLTDSGNTVTLCKVCEADTLPNLLENRCERCTNILSSGGTGTNCDCPNLVGGICLSGPAVKIINTVPLSSGTEISPYIEEHLNAVFEMCNVYDNATACQVLGNLCVLTWYRTSGGDDSCGLYKQIERPEAPLPNLYYDANQGDDFIAETLITTVYTFDPKSTLNFVVAKYSLEGKYLGTVDVRGGLLQLCKESVARMDAAYTFGTYYSQSCSISALDLFDSDEHPTEFYDMYLKFTVGGVTQLYMVPVLISNVISENTGSAAREWQLVKRFYLIDNVSTKPLGTGSIATYLRYAKNIEIVIRLRSDGLIYPPYLKITYGEFTENSAKEGGSLSAVFRVSYSMTVSLFERDFQIAVGTLGTLAVLYGGYRTWVWSKRAGRIAIDFQSLINFIFFLCGSLANIFFLVTFGLSFYWLIFFKRQDVVYLIHPDGLALLNWQALFGTAFALKALQVLHMIAMQVTADVFLIDWERPRGIIAASGGGVEKKGHDAPVSIWRTYFVANEWNELQTLRKINKTFQIFASVFFLVVVGFQDAATMDPNGSVDKSGGYQSEHSYIYRHALAVLTYLVIALIQWIFFTFIYERFVEDKVRQFVDLCCLSNISLFVMAHAQYGYYIHGRTIHGKADTDMREMFEMIMREEENLCGQRGLLPNTDQQTFIMSLPRKLRLKYEQVMMPVSLERATGPSRMEQGRTTGRISGTSAEKQVDAYVSINKFFSAFIDHSLKDLDYVVKDKTMLENIMDTEFLDASEKGIFYNDGGHAFDQVLFYGNEITLILFDTLLFCIVDHIFTDFVLAGVLTYIISELIDMLRDNFGRKNLAKKTLVDERFLI